MSRFSAEGRVGRGYELAFDDPLAKLLNRYFTVSTSKWKMDHSSGELEGEIDHLSRDAAIEYLLMPEQVKKLEGQVTALAGLVEDLRGDVRELVDVLKGALNGHRDGGGVPEHVQKGDPLGMC